MALFKKKVSRQDHCAEWCSTKGNRRRLQLRCLQLAFLVERFLPVKREGLIALCIGCRDNIELDAIEHACGIKTKGLDLEQTDPRIEVGDMHKMRFEDGSFEVIYSAYNLHHAKDLQVVVDEFLRVTKPGGLVVIETPVQFTDYDKTTTVNSKGWVKVDAKSTKHLLELMGDRISEVLVREDFVSRDNPELIARLIVRRKD